MKVTWYGGVGFWLVNKVLHVGLGFYEYDTWSPLHKTFTGEKTLVKSENSGTHEFTIYFTIGRNSG